MNGPALDPGFTTSAMSEIFGPAATVAAYCRFEAALALALADAGLIDSQRAEAIEAACRPPLDSPDTILASTWETGTPIIGVVTQIQDRLDYPEDRRWVHHGATTQDAVDTAHVLQARQGLQELDRGLIETAALMGTLADAHRDQPQMGRTFLQHAVPTTFGLRAAMWLDATLQHVDTLRNLDSALTVQLGGPVGNLAGYGGSGSEVVTALARHLDLRAPDVAWHADRSRVVALMQALERMSSTLAKVAHDIALLAQSDVSEVRSGQGASSSMPHKRNPIAAVRAIAAAEACAGATSMMARTRHHELDRGLGGWHVEWLALPLVFQTAAAVVQSTAACLRELEVDGQRMRAPVDTARLDTPSIDTPSIDTGAGGTDHRQIDRVLARLHRLSGDE